MTAVPTFEWDEAKNRLNQQKHGVGFELAQFAFFDERRIIAKTLATAARSSVIIASAGLRTG